MPSGNQGLKSGTLGIYLVLYSTVAGTQATRQSPSDYFLTFPRAEKSLPVATTGSGPQLILPGLQSMFTQGQRAHQSVCDLSQISQRLGSFSSDPTKYIQEFQYLTLSYNLTWSDLNVILTSTLSPDERERVFSLAQFHADNHQLHEPDLREGIRAVPREDPQWNYQADSPGIARRDYMISCLVEGLKKAAYKAVNYDKLKQTTQGKDENLAQFMGRLAATLRRFTALDPERPEGRPTLNMHFITQTTPDTRKKLQKLESGHQTPQQELINLAFKVYNNREEAARQQRISELQLLAFAVRQNRATPPAYKNFKMPKPHMPKQQQSSIPTRLPPSGSCFKCQKSGH
nr:uncharacterized protein LOC123568255 [Macaca fascicularis]